MSPIAFARASSLSRRATDSYIRFVIRESSFMISSSIVMSASAHTVFFERADAETSPEKRISAGTTSRFAMSIIVSASIERVLM